MKIFLDTANIEEIRKANATIGVDGVTTNPSIILRDGNGKDQKTVIGEISQIVKGPISVEGIGDTAEEMIKEGEEYSKWGSNIVVKIPMTEEGLKAVRVLESKGIKTNVTLVFSVSQALLAAKAGASFLSPFVGRLDDIQENGMDLIKDIVTMYNNYGFKSEVIVASIRSLEHVKLSALYGAHIATIPGKVYAQMWKHDLTDKGIAKFKEDWEKTKK